jgi:hypothetical protein
MTRETHTAATSDARKRLAEQVKACPRCGDSKPLSEFHRGHTRPADICKPCKREYNYQRKYGCQPAGSCEVCGEAATRVDHDHACCPRDVTRTCGNCVRGFLCNDCNTGLGMFKDNPRRLHFAAEYLQRVQQGLGATNSPDAATGTSGTVSGAVSESVPVDAVTLTEVDGEELAYAFGIRGITPQSADIVRRIVARHVAPLAAEVARLEGERDYAVRQVDGADALATESEAKHAALVEAVEALLHPSRISHFGFGDDCGYAPTDAIRKVIKDARGGEDRG